MSQQQVTPKLSPQELHAEIKKEYASVALNPGKGYHFHTGRAALSRLGYEEHLYADLPEETIASFAGTGNPFSVGTIHPGDTVVDVGSGSGLDPLIAARMSGPTGQVIGFDMTPEMLELAREGATATGMANVEFREGYAESLPIPDDFADVVTSNGMLNLMLDKTATLREWFRVLKPGGRLQIGDILVSRAIPQGALDDISLWTGWIAGGLQDADLIHSVSAAGFEDVQIVHKYADLFMDVPDPSSAMEYGTQGISFRALKPN